LTSGHSDAQGWASKCPDVKNYKWRLNPVWCRMLYSCTHMATVGIKGLNHFAIRSNKDGDWKVALDKRSTARMTDRSGRWTMTNTWALGNPTGSWRYGSTCRT